MAGEFTLFQGTTPESLKYQAPQPYPGAGSGGAAQVDSGLVAGAMGGLSTPNTAGNVATVDPKQWSGQQASGYTASTGAANQWDVADNQTVKGQINSVIAEDSPLMQQAATRAKQEAGNRGLINSSMAVQAGHAAVIDKALPIAQADAQTYGQAAKSNQDAKNSFEQFNANAKNTAGQFNAGAKNTLQSQTMDLEAKTALTNAGAVNEATSRDAQLASQQGIAKLDGALKVAMQNADAAGKLQYQQIDANVRTTMANIEATYKNQMQTSQSMAGSYQSLIDNITRIMQDKDMSAGAKQAAIDNQTTLYNNTLQMQSQLSGLELGSLLSFDDLAAPTAGANVNEFDGLIQDAQYQNINTYGFDR
jgi:hypothetical protein